MKTIKIIMKVISIQLNIQFKIFNNIFKFAINKLNK